MNRWIATALIGVVALMLLVPTFIIFNPFGGRPAGPAVGGVTPPGAKPVAQLTPTPCVPPPGFARCPEQGVRPAETFDWGEGPKIDVGGLLQPLRPQLLPTPTPKSEPFLNRAKEVPVLGAPIALITGILGAIDWIIRNLWLVIILAALMAFVFRMPIWAPFLIVWELLQTFWKKDKTVDDVWGKHKGSFKRPDKHGQEPRTDRQERRT